MLLINGGPSSIIIICKPSRKNSTFVYLKTETKIVFNKSCQERAVYEHPCKVVDYQLQFV